MTRRFALIVLTLVTFLVYLPSFGNHFVWDDEQFIYDNIFVKTFDVAQILQTNTIAGAGELSNYYRPLTTLTFAWDHAFWGLNPIGFHLTNTLLHIGSGLCIFLLFSLLFTKTSNIKLQTANQLAFWLSLFFLLHPLQTEAVTYANSRGDSLYTFITLLGLLSFNAALWIKKIHKSWSGNEIIITQPMLLSMAPFFFFTSLFAKEIALASAGLYCLSWLLHWLHQEDIKITWHSTLKKIKEQWQSLVSLTSIVALTGFYLLLRATILNFKNSFNFYSGANAYSESIIVRFSTFSRIFFDYLRLLFVPFPLHMERQPEIVTTLLSPWSLGFVSVFLLVLGLGWWEYRKEKTFWILFGMAWFGVMLLPVSGIIPINGLMYEHWLYLPMVGFWLAVGRLILLIGVHWLKKKQQFVTISLTSVCTIWAVLTLRQNYLWGTPIRFYEYTLQFAQSARLHNNLGMAYSEKSQFEEAIEQYQAALEYAPYPQIYFNLGNLYQQQEDYDKALEYYQQALDISPDFHQPYLNMTNIYLEQEKFSEALDIIRILRELYPDNTDFKRLEIQLTSNT